MTKGHLNLIRDLVERIETHLEEDANIIGLAGSVGLSPWHFQRLFKSLVGDSLGSYIRGRRLSCAAELLRGTDEGIIDIALRSGFNSHEAFSRSFKAYFDHTPKEMRSLKPNITLNEKPALTSELISFLANRIESEPTIQVLPERRIFGYTIEIPSPFLDPVHCSTIAQPWMKLLDRARELVDIQKATFYGITLSPSGNFTEETLTYVAGLQLDDLVSIPPDLFEVIIPAQQVAVFDVTTNVTDDNLKQKIDSIYGYWLGNSRFVRGNGNDYEIFQNIKNLEKGQFDASYVVPVTEK